MSAEQDFVLSLAPRAIISGTEFYVPFQEVFAFLEGCDRENVLILGMDGFKIDDQGGIWPQREHIYATTSGQSVQMAVQEVREYFRVFLPGDDHDLHFSFVLEHPF